MKVLSINYEYYEFPEGFDNIESFIQYINNNYHSFIPLNQFNQDNCIFPYLVQEDIEKVYVNFSQIKIIKEEDATVLSRNEYDTRLREVVNSKCINCTNYEEDNEGDNLKGHRGKISLDGECFYYAESNK